MGVLIFSGCKIKYSFTGASIPPEAKTVSIQYFPNNAPLVQPSLSQLLTEALKDRFLTETNLALVEQNGDLNFEGSIINYVVTPVAIQGDETAAMNRLSITIRVKFINIIDEKQNYENNFSRYEDYLSTSDLSSVEEELITTINVQLVDDIFNKAVINW
ncbi:MAG TPA: hypothetical protein EYM84_11040 [Flavobacteriales bacterium]|nr:hypothetical protein [Flavobacteriales bacterium]HIN40793.1 hypothetical protein [Flavobacteriales bacterium]